jgi:4-methyl-5(b-hydroxyethyl)-thiazole monophosphate biosynthesis
MVSLLVLLASGFEEIEAITVIDILRRAEINVTIAGIDTEFVTGSHDITVKCDIGLAGIESEQYSGIFLPGGQPGSNNLKANTHVLKLIQEFSQENKLIAAICAAPIVLYEAGIIKNRQVTSYPSEKEKFVNCTYLEKNVVRDGNIITSRGVGTAIEFALSLVEIIRGRASKEDLAKRILWSS